MNKKEQDILKKIDEKTKDTNVPEGLSPENIEQMLKDRKKSGHSKLRPLKIAGVAAACLCLIAGIAVMWPQSRGADMSSSSGSAKRETANESGQMDTAKDYDQIYSYFENLTVQARVLESTQDISAGDTGVQVQESAQEMSGASGESQTSSVSADSAKTKGGYSDTNVRQQGVDEGDVAKTDGRYLFVLKDGHQEIAIIDTAKDLMEEVSFIKAEDGDYIEEFYLEKDQNKLITVCSVQKTSDDNEIMPRGGWGYMSQNTKAITYDISSIESPKEEGEVTQTGQYNSSRLTDGYLYLFSDYYVSLGTDDIDPEFFVPSINRKTMDANAIYIPPSKNANMYEVITSIDITKPSETADSKAILSQGGQLYVSNDNIYYYENVWKEPDQNSTIIRKVSYKDGQFNAAKQGKIKGYIKDSFCIDEYDKHLRIVTTAGETNSVYVLDEKLNLTGSIEGLAKDERVYSARFMGDVGYFVTFRETDPLFSVDLSDPKTPKIIGALKIPGFSEYLHFYGENQLLGIGMDVDEDTQVTNGVKLTMFDISDKTDVKEAHTYVMKNVYSTDVFYDYKAVLADVQKNLIGFSGQEEGGENYYLFSYDKDNGFTCHMTETVNGNGKSTRGIYIDDTLYVIKGNIIEAYSLKEYKKIDDIIL